MNFRRLAFAVARFSAVACLSLPVTAWPHAFGERYDLPAPLAYFVVGAALTVALSFAVIVAMARGASHTSPAVGLVVPLGPLLPALRHACRFVALAVLGLVVIAGLYGDPHPAKNLAPTLVWIVWWVGMSLVAACAGNIWPAFDPWRTLYEIADAIARSFGMSGISLGWTYPLALDAWPAVILLLLFAWLEVVYPQSSVPARIACLVIAWSTLMLLGMICFGREVWQRNADAFAVYFATLGRFAPLASAADGRSIVLRLPGRGLVATVAVPAAMVAFVIAMLASVLFDGLLGTQAWRFIDRAISAWVPRLVDREGCLLGTIGLLGVWLLFLVAYLLTCWFTAQLVRDRTVSALARLFVLSLVPIAVAYNLAHNFSYLLVQGQGLIPLLSDPLGRGWNLFSTRTFEPNIGIVDSRFTWYVAIIAIVAGHVISVWLAHRVALREFGSPRRAVIASVPLTVLMVFYTAISLSIIAEPLVRFRMPDPSYSRNDSAEPLPVPVNI